MANAAKLKQPGSTAAHRRLEVFIGHWHAEGTSYGDGQDAADPRAAGVPWTSDETYEWLPGHFFVLHRWDAQMGKHDFKGAENMGYARPRVATSRACSTTPATTRSTPRASKAMSGTSGNRRHAQR